MSAWGLFRSLSSKSRLAVIEVIKEKPSKYSEIMDKTGLSTTDISRQLNRLSSDLIVEKNSSDQYKLTQYGKITATSVPLIQFLVDNQAFFNTHDLSSIPEELFENIASLRHGTMVDSIYESIKLQQEIIPTVSEHYSMMTDDMGPIWLDTTQKLIDDGVTVRAIFTPKLADKVVKEAPSKLIAYMQIRTMSPLKLVLGYSDKHALLCFPSLNGKPDRNHYLFGYDLMFKHWAFHCFNYFWRQASPIKL